MRKTIINAAEVLVDQASTPIAQRQAANELFDVLSGLIGFDDRKPGELHIEDTWVDGGRAISLREAARCVREHARTAKFMRGVQQAISEARRRFPGETIRVLYAGSGPFAPLVLPLAHRWAADQVRYTLLDIHRHSLDATRLVADLLDVEDRIDARMGGDAVRHCVAEADRPHVLVTETMTQGLATETQVAICRNLVPQLRHGGLLVPQRIELLATLYDVNADDRDMPGGHGIELGPVMILDADNAAHGGDCFEIDWPVGSTDGHRAQLRTHIQVFGDIELRDRECSLNLPMTLPMPEGSEHGDRLAFRYEFVPKPGLRAEWVGPTRLGGLSETRSSGDDDPYLKLPLNFGVEALQAELDALERGGVEGWASHPNTNDYQGEWRSLALRSASGSERDTAMGSIDPGDFTDTDAMCASPALAAVVAALPGRPTSARLLSLRAGARIREHRDVETRLWGGLARLHVPIRTDERVDFRIAGQRIDMRPGECWYINANHPHSVNNDSDIDRVHLVVDCAVDEQDIEQFVAWGHRPRPAPDFDSPDITLDNVDAVIRQLRSLGNEAAEGLADRLSMRAEQLRGGAAVASFTGGS